MDKQNEIAVSNVQLHDIQTRIYEVRGVRVMLDFDLAQIYQVETRILNQAVKRNLSRFPEDFMFRLSEEEWERISSQIVMTSRSKRPKSALPFAFTEHGLVMLASILHSEIAINASVSVTRAFIAMRNKIISLSNTEQKLALLSERITNLGLYIENILHDQNDINEETSMQLELINQSLAELRAKPKDSPRRRIGFEGNY